MRRWTIKDLNGLDDITFSMIILSERCEMLNQEAPLAKKLRSAYHMLDNIRGGCSVNGDVLLAIRERIYREVQREYAIEDIKRQLGLVEDSDGEYYVNLHGLEPKQVFADTEIMDRIIGCLDKCGCGDGYWDNVDYSISKGIEDVLETREEV